jgi:ferric-dicitrate binding protein FerR (iron transport regulator)
MRGLASRWQFGASSVAALVAAGLAACVPIGPPRGPSPDGGAPPPPPERALIGILDVEGPGVRRNGAPARDGDRVRDGDTVTTGAGSSARVLIAGGGLVQLDADTDPEFRFALLAQGWCILVQILSGQVFADSQVSLQRGPTCLELRGPGWEVPLNSAVNVKVGPRETTVTVVQGRVEIRQVPVRGRAPGPPVVARRVAPVRSVTLQAGEQVTIGPRMSPIQRVSPPQILLWRTPYFRARPIDPVRIPPALPPRVIN